MKVMARQLPVLRGEVVYQKGITVTHMQQEVPAGLAGTVFDVVLFSQVLGSAPNF